MTSSGPDTADGHAASSPDRPRLLAATPAIQLEALRRHLDHMGRIFSAGLNTTLKRVPEESTRHQGLQVIVKKYHGRRSILTKVIQLIGETNRRRRHGAGDDFKTRDDGEVAG